MSNKTLNIILYVTALVAVAVIIVFFIKLSNVEPVTEESKNGTETVDAGKIEGLSSLTGKQDTETDKNTSPDIPDGTGEADPSDISGTVQGPEDITPTDAPLSPDDTTPTDVPATPTEIPVTVAPEPTKDPDGKTVSVDVSGIDPTKPIVALSFDDGPSANTASIIETLTEYGAHATFFMVGENVNMYPERVKMVYDAGCEVGNHTVSHKALDKLTKEQVTKEIEDNQKNINAALGVTINSLVRPPYGNVSDTVREAAEHPLINWSVDTLDWKSRNADSVFEEVKKSTRDGSIILMHDLYASTAEAVKKVVPWLVEQGYQICSVSEMFAARGVPLENGHVYNSVMNAAKYKESLEKSDSET
ncbi:MAG: polysaccharide deacetylase family protein [Lachnospiraceae bacterium]|nr:polysaccharide deacetylase family protein [Lachnospiraceae bacterium]